MKVHFKTLAVICCTMLAIAQNASAQIVFVPVPKPVFLLAYEGGTGTKEKCSCGGSSYDCVCRILPIMRKTGRETRMATSHAATIASQRFSGNTLTLILTDKFPPLKTNIIHQKEEVPLDPDTSIALGYRAITILAGDYEIKNGNSITLTVRLGEKVTDTTTK